MKLTLELSTTRLIQSAGFAHEITSLAQSYGEGSRIEIQVLREGVLVTPTELEEFVFVVKPQNEFAADPLSAGCETFTWDSAIERWVGEINYNVAALTAQLHTAGTGTDQQEYMTFWAQLGWRLTSGSSWQRSQLIKNFRLDNALWKGDEVFPSLGTPIEGSTGPWLTPLVRSITADVVNNAASANTIADITGLSFPVEAGESYHFRFVIPFTSAASTTGKRFAINGPTKSALHLRSRYSLTTSTETTNHVVTDYDLPASSDATSPTTGGLAILEGFIVPTANGNVIARFASEVSSSAITAKAGAHVQYTKVS